MLAYLQLGLHKLSPGRLWREHTRRRYQKQLKEWQYRVSDTLVTDVLPDGTPYQYDTALSFLQPVKFDPHHPSRVSLFLPEVPVAIDLLGMEDWPHYRDAAPYVSFNDWTALQVEISLKRHYFNRFCCAYLQIYQGEPCDSASLTERLRELLGFYIS